MIDGTLLIETGDEQFASQGDLNTIFVICPYSLLRILGTRKRPKKAGEKSHLYHERIAQRQGNIIC